MENIINKMPVAKWHHRPMKVEGLTIHYAAGNDVAPQYTTQAQLVDILRGYARYHIENIPNDSLAYTFVVDKWGNQYQTRGIQKSYHTANVWGNNHTLGILCPLGSYEEPTEEQVLSLYRLISKLRMEYGIPSRYVVGHKELSNTPCPGKLMPYVLDYRKNAAPVTPSEPEAPVIDETFTPGWYVVVHNGRATIRCEPNTQSDIILTLPSDYREYIHNRVKGEEVGGSSDWYQTQSDYGEGYIHSSGIERT